MGHIIEINSPVISQVSAEYKSEKMKLRRDLGTFSRVFSSYNFT